MVCQFRNTIIYKFKKKSHAYKNMAVHYTYSYNAASPSVSLVSQVLCNRCYFSYILTQQQQSNTMRKDWRTPAIPTIHVSRRKRITPKIFCMHGKYTPIRVPMLGDWKKKKVCRHSLSGGIQSIGNQKTYNFIFFK